MISDRRRFIALGGLAGVGLAFSRLSHLAGAAVARDSGPLREAASEPPARLPTVNDGIRAAVAVTPGMLFDGNTPAELAAWQRKFSQKLRDLIGPHDPPANWTARSLGRTVFDDFVREEVLLVSENAPSLPLYVLRPRAEKPAKLPMVVCLHGHGFGGHDLVAGRADSPVVAEEIRRFNYDYGRQLARAGFLAVAPCLTPFGRRLEESQRPTKVHGLNDPCAMTFARLMVLGRTVVGENLRDVKWALDYATGRPDARADRIGCVGISYGARMTTIATALDPRIGVAVVCGNQTMYQERVIRNVFCGSQVIPGLLKYGDTPEIGSLIAPRPAMWAAGADDVMNNGRDWHETGKPRLQRAYAVAGRPAALGFHSFKGGEAWDGATAPVFLAEALK